MDALTSIDTYWSCWVLHFGEASDPYNPPNLGVVVPCTQKAGSSKLKVGHRERSQVWTWGEVDKENEW